MKLFKFEPKNGMNFGDELGPLIVNSLLDSFRLMQPEQSFRGRLFSVGSVIHFTNIHDIVWGSGINGKVTLPINTISRTYRAVRGPLTQNILSQNGIECPRIYGDPAILLPKIYNPAGSIHSEGKILVIPNYNDFALIKNDILKYQNTGNFLLLHPYIPPLMMIDLIVSAQAVITSSLHAKIIADSYKIQNAVLGGEGYAEHPFKYVDYVQGIGHQQQTFYPDISSALDNIEDPQLIEEGITAKLQDAFPKELFDAY